MSWQRHLTGQTKKNSGRFLPASLHLGMITCIEKCFNCTVKKNHCLCVCVCISHFTFNMGFFGSPVKYNWDVLYFTILYESNVNCVQSRGGTIIRTVLHELSATLLSISTAAGRRNKTIFVCCLESQDRKRMDNIGNPKQS